MPQIQVFQCPSCGASLSFEGGPETTITCQFCGANVAVPQELRAQAAPPQAMPPLAPGAGPVPGSQPVPRKRAQGCGWRSRLSCLSGLGCLAIVASIAGFQLLFFYLPIRLSGSYALALSTAQADPRVVKALGEPIEADWWIWVSSWQCRQSCWFYYTLGLHGSQASGQLAVVANSRSGGSIFEPAGWKIYGGTFTGPGPILWTGPALNLVAARAHPSS